MATDFTKYGFSNWPPFNELFTPERKQTPRERIQEALDSALSDATDELEVTLGYADVRAMVKYNDTAASTITESMEKVANQAATIQTLTERLLRTNNTILELKQKLQKAGEDTQELQERNDRQYSLIQELERRNSNQSPTIQSLLAQMEALRIELAAARQAAYKTHLSKDDRYHLAEVLGHLEEISSERYIDCCTQLVKGVLDA